MTERVIISLARELRNQQRRRNRKPREPRVTSRQRPPSIQELRWLSSLTSPLNPRRRP